MVSDEGSVEAGGARERLTDGQLARVFALMAIAEACTWAALLFGMYLKYVPQSTELGVKIAGTLHGIAFLGYVVVAFAAGRQLAWSGRQTALAVVAAFPPFGTIVFERWASRRGLLDAGGR